MDRQPTLFDDRVKTAKPKPAKRKKVPVDQRAAADHEKHPERYALFKARAMQQRAAGKTRISPKRIIEDLRDERAHPVADDGVRFNNSYAKFYGQLLVAEDPWFDGKIVFRGET